MRQTLGIAILSLVLLGLIEAQGAVSPSSKSNIIERLQANKKNQLEQLDKITKQIRARLAESQNISIKPAKSPSGDNEKASEAIKNFTQALEQLSVAREEASARRDILDQLILQVSKRWDGDGSLRGALQEAAFEMAVVAATNEASERNHTKFFSYLSIALKDGLDTPSERPEDVIGFVEDYMDFASVIDPKPPQEFLKNRSYTNGVRSEPAQLTSKVSAGDAADKFVNSKSEKGPAITQKVKIQELIPRPISTIE